MININKLFFNVLEEGLESNNTRSKPIVDAINNRNPITFYYSGPRSGKDSVKSGGRYRAEAVAMGLSKKGNLIVRAWVQPPSVSKSGFSKSGWRTFMVGRMTNVTILNNETFDQKRPGYKEGNDNSMSVTYVTADWTKKPETKQIQKPEPPKPEVPKPEPVQQVTPQEKPKPEVSPTEPQKVEPQKQELPQPKPEVKPEPVPTTEVPPKEEPTQQVPNQNNNDEQKRLYDLKLKDWVAKQKELGLNTKPGQGTRARFNKEIEKELPQPKPEVKPTENPDDQENEMLKESIKRIKRLMFS
jgi:hypothetical protein